MKNKNEMLAEDLDENTDVIVEYLKIIVARLDKIIEMQTIGD